jgi:serine/threonine protein kinase
MAKAEDSTLIRYISEALEISDQGLKPSIEEICGERTDLVPEVLAAVEFERFLPSLQDESAIHDAHLGQTVGNRYRLDSLLGAGSMGMVYHAEDLDLRRSVAVKILRTDVLAIDEAEARFIREAEALAAVHHHSVVTIFDRGITETGALFLVTELLNGLPLSDLIEETKQRSGPGQLEDISWMETDLGLSSISEMSYLRTVVRWIADLASGLAAAHDAGIFHRDIKPSNVLVRCDGPPVLLDFGIASLDSQATIVEREGALGTPAYMAPESLEDVPAGAPRDVYSLTATLYHLLTLRAPYSGSPSQVIATLGRRDPRPAYRLRPGLPRDLQAILDRGMCREVAGRYPSARDLEADLRAFLDYRSVSARPITSLERGWRRLRRSSAFRAGAVVALVLIGASAATSWRSNYVEAQSARALDIWKHVPPMLTLWNAADRYIADEDERQELRGLLGEVVEASVNPLPAQLYRAGFRLDHGDVEGAAADMAVIADSVDTEFARALARIYAVQASDDSGQLEITLGDLPKLDSPLDSYLAGYHMLRQATSYADYRRVEQLLQAPGLEEHAFAMDILLPVQQELVAEEKTVLGRREAARVI